MDGISWIPKYTYGSFWYSTGIGWFLYFILCDWMYALKVVAGIGLLFGQPVMAHLGFLVPFLPNGKTYLFYEFVVVWI
jgi:hypothetical protein